MYYAFSRPTWLLGVFSVIIAILTGHFGFARALLASGNLRIVGRTLIICCVIQIVVIELLFCTNATPLGIQLTFSTCLLFGLGFILVTIIIALPIMIFVEWPFTRLLHLFVLPYISHDKMLMEHHRKKMVEATDSALP